MAEQVTVTIPQKLYRRVRDLAKARQRPVDDVLAEVLEGALPPTDISIDAADMPSEDAAVAREMQAYIALHPMLKEKYPGRHVAIYGGQLIDMDDDYAALYQRIEAQYPDEFVWLATVEDEAIPTLVFRSPRFFRPEPE